MKKNEENIKSDNKDKMRKFSSNEKNKRKLLENKSNNEIKNIENNDQKNEIIMNEDNKDNSQSEIKNEIKDNPKNDNYFSNIKFSELNLNKILLERLTLQGYETVTEIHAKSIPIALKGEDIQQFLLIIPLLLYNKYNRLYKNRK